MRQPLGHGGLAGTPYGYHSGYGAASCAEPSANEILTLKGPRRRMNGLAVVQAWLLPCGVFAGVMVVMSLPIWREHTVHVAFLMLCSLLVTAALAGRAWAAYRQRPPPGSEGPPAEEPSWYLFLAVSCLIAWLAALILGSVNYSARLSPHFDLSSLGLARNVSPADLPGTRHLDVSRIEFKEGSRVAEELSLGFKDGATYCAAPVVGNSTAETRLASYDYWAVGINCCNPLPPAAFWCGDGDVSDPSVHGGVRWMGDSKFFLLAIQQAEAEYGYQAMHPILFTWTKDPIGQVEGLHTAGMDFLYSCIATFASLQAVLVLAFLCAWAPSSAALLDQLLSTTPAGADKLGGSSADDGAARGWAQSNLGDGRPAAEAVPLGWG